MNLEEARRVKAEIVVIEAAREIVALWQLGAGGEALHPIITDLDVALTKLDDALAAEFMSVEPVKTSPSFDRRIKALLDEAKSRASSDPNISKEGE